MGFKFNFLVLKSWEFNPNISVETPIIQVLQLLRNLRLSTNCLINEISVSNISCHKKCTCITYCSFM